MDQEYADYNPLYPLYVRRFTRGLSIHRMADDARIATIIVRDMSQVARHQWDPSTGKFLSIFYKDGIVRIYDGFRSGRLVSLLRAGKDGVVSGVWDRIELEHSDKSDGNWSIDHDITEMMPKMVKFARDSHQLCVIPYSLPSDVWRLPTADDTNQVLDAHVIRCVDNLSVMLNGEFSLSISLPQVPSSLVKFVLAQHRYLAFYQDGSVEKFDLANLTENPFALRLLKDVVTMRQLYQYLQDHIELVQRDLIQPYDEFLERCCQGAFGGYDPLREQLQELMLLGAVTPELEDWLVNSVGEKNLKRWRKLGTDAYHKTLQVLTLACLPACERLISLGQKCRGNLLSQQMNPPSIDSLQLFLKNILETIANLSSQQRLLGSFLDWFDDRVHESIDEDYKLRSSIHDNSGLGPDLASYLQLRLSDSSTEFSAVASLTHSLTKMQGCLSPLDSILFDEIASKIRIVGTEDHTNAKKTFFDPLDLTVININSTTSPATSINLNPEYFRRHELILLANRSQIILLDPQSLTPLSQLPLRIPQPPLLRETQEKKPWKEQEFIPPTAATNTMGMGTTSISQGPVEQTITRAHWQHTTLQLLLEGTPKAPIKTALDFQVTPNGDQWSLALQK